MRSGVSSSHPHFYAADSESEERPHLLARLPPLLDVSVTRFCILRLVSVALKFMQHHGCCCCCFYVALLLPLLWLRFVLIKLCYVLLIVACHGLSFGYKNVFCLKK